jgi:short-subunit dehydrogenase
MARNLKDAVVVITGASSGIGREAALAFVQRGARVVVAARREEPLQDLVAEIGQVGGEAIAVPTDVTEPEAVQALARRAVETYGRLDVWVNNAAVGVFGTFEETPLDAYLRVIETNLFGYIYGARAALPIFREQGSGVLINNASVMGKISAPYQSAYVASKHAIRGLGMSLRQELTLAKAKDIHIATVMPATIDTPFFLHAGNYAGRAARAMPPVYPPESVAKAMVRVAEHPRREVYVGNAGRMMQLQFLLAPGFAERQAAKVVDKLHLHQDKTTPPTPGNVFEPMPEGTTETGGWKAGGASTSRKLATAGAAAAIPATALLWRRRSNGNGNGNGHSSGSNGHASGPATKLGKGLLQTVRRG